jgi:hypothetical protein
VFAKYTIPEIIIQTALKNAIEVTENEKVKLITPPTVILVPSEDLAKQTYNELKDRYPNLLLGMDFLSKKEFEEAVLWEVENPSRFRSELERLWNEAEVSYRAAKEPGLRHIIPFSNVRIEAADCFTNTEDPAFIAEDRKSRFASGGGLIFCLDRRAVAEARRTLKIAEVAFDPKTIKWDKSIDAVKQITKLRDEGLYEPKTDEWKSEREFAELFHISHNQGDFQKLWQFIERQYSQDTDSPIIVNGHTVNYKWTSCRMWIQTCK